MAFPTRHNLWQGYGRVIAVQKLKALAHAVNVQHPNCLNRLSHPRALVTPVTEGRRETHDCDKGDMKAGQRGNDTSVHINVWAAGADGSADGSSLQ